MPGVCHRHRRPAHSARGPGEDGGRPSSARARRRSPPAPRANSRFNAEQVQAQGRGTRATVRRALRARAHTSCPKANSDPATDAHASRVGVRSVAWRCASSRFPGPLRDRLVAACCAGEKTARRRCSSSGKWTPRRSRSPASASPSVDSRGPAGRGDRDGLAGRHPVGTRSKPRGRGGRGLRERGAVAHGPRALLERRVLPRFPLPPPPPLRERHSRRRQRFRLLR